MSFKNALLNKLGYAKTFPLKMTYGPQDIGGTGLLHLYQKQGGDGICLLIRHLRMHNGVLPATIRVALSWFHQYAGTSNHPLSNTTTNMPHLLHGWLKIIREFLIFNNCSLWFQECIETKIEPRRLHDRVLMDG